MKNWIGFTQKPPEARLKEHLDKNYGNQKYTAAAEDWEIVFTIACASIGQANHIEKHIKRMKSKKYILNLIRYPEMTERLKEKYPGSSR